MVDEQLKKNEAAKPEDADVAKLRAVFPDCFTKNGAVDFEKLQAKFDGKVKIENEGYRLDFLGKSYARLLTALETTTVVKPDLEHNQKPENAKSCNVYLTADNLDALKQLVKSYAGEVKMIYIDPPYNTGSDGFVYNDKFNFSEKELCDKLGVDEQQAKRILGFTKRNASSHSAWLTFMYPRLMLARELLTKDGVIFISIDDNEQANLKLLCDDVFGEENFITQLIWKSKSGGAADSSYVAVDHEYILCYARKINESGFNLDADAIVTTSYNLTDEKGRYSLDRLDKQSLGYHESLDFPILGPDGVEYRVLHKNPQIKVARWRWSRDTVKERYDELVFKDGYVYTKNYEKDASMPRSVLVDDRYGRTRTGKTECSALFGFEVFQSPKPTKLIQWLIDRATSDGDVVLDFFSGSGTTAHAVLKRNVSSGDRRFVLVQLAEPCDPKKEAYKQGFKTIDEIGRKRIELAAAKIRTENSEKAAALDLGFKHYTLVEPSQETLDKVDSFDKAASLVGDEGMLKEFGLETVLATWMVRDGYGFGVEPEVVTFGGYAAYWHKKHLYFVKDGLDEQGVKDLMDRYETDPTFSPVNVVIFGYGVSMTMRENLKTNLAKLVDSEKDLKVNIEVRY